MKTVTSQTCIWYHALPLQQWFQTSRDSHNKHDFITTIWCETHEKGPYEICGQRRPRSAAYRINRYCSIGRRTENVLIGLHVLHRVYGLCEIFRVCFFFFSFFFFFCFFFLFFFFVFSQDTLLVPFCVLYYTPSPILKEVNSKRKEFAPNGSKFFPFRVDPFPEGRQFWRSFLPWKYINSP